MSDIVAPVHADLRSDSHSYKRDKNHNSKWAFGLRTGRMDGNLGTAWTAQDPPATHVRIVPEKPSTRSSNAAKSNPNVSTKTRGITHYGTESANLRLTRKSDALRDAKSEDSKSLSRSLADLLPSTATAVPIEKNKATEGDILYSFDKKNSPSDSVNLGGLIAAAEKKFQEKQTDKLVRKEYEVLDVNGEKETRKSKRAAVGATKSVAVVTLDDDEDYELV